MFSRGPRNEPGSGEDTALGAEHAFNGELRTALVGGVVVASLSGRASTAGDSSVMTPSWESAYTEIVEMYT